jgi:hypothetical protein
MLTINGPGSKDIATRVNIDLPAGKIDLVTGIYDLNSGDTGTLEVPQLQVAASPVSAQGAAH